MVGILLFLVGIDSLWLPLKAAMGHKKTT